MPTTITEFGIVASIQELCGNSHLENGNIFQFHSIGGMLNVSPIVMLTMYRITQELIANCQKHSGASAASVSIALNHEEQTIKLTCSDNGIGFSIKMKSKGLGLSNIQNRLNLINGSMSIEKVSSLNIVNINIPYEPKV
jgi:signal transduction histidine kinase